MGATHKQSSTGALDTNSALRQCSLIIRGALFLAPCGWYVFANMRGHTIRLGKHNYRPLVESLHVIPLG